MCIPKEERIKRKIVLWRPNYGIQRFHERGRDLFGKENFEEMFIETKRIICDETRCVIVPDERRDEKIKSNYVAIFLTDYGRLAAIPIFVNETHIFILTVKDVEKDEINPNWYVNGYNAKGNERGLTRLPLYFRK